MLVCTFLRGDFLVLYVPKAPLVKGSWRGAPERPIKQQSRRPVEGLRLCCYGKEVKVSVKCRFKSEVDLSVVVAALE